MDKKKKDYLSYTLICQFIVCGLLFAVIFGLKNINSDIFTRIEDEFFVFTENEFDLMNLTKTNNADATESTEKQVTTPDITEKQTEDTITPNQTTDENLSAKITGEGGQDYAVESIDDVPDNVSVNSYVLNQKMVLPVDGKVTSEFGVRTHPIKNELRFHAGIDIAADAGTPIYSAFTGEVVLAEYDKWNGNYMKIQHEGDIMTVYCHCEKLCVKKGDFVEAGDVIGYVGSTGSSTGPHLHFEFRIGNVSYDPQTALEEAISAV